MKNPVVEKSIEVALSIIEYCELLQVEKKYVISRQLLKSGTSIGANVHEAQNAESKADFIHKIKIAAKELEETKYWLTLCEKSKYYPNHSGLNTKVNELGLIIYKILSTSIKSRKQN
ncbi:four helix bundle protein [Lutibacter sp. Hel_I_33_5]|uniref:four helix bundle protein n=1 Tax=Lutibacter sp. Hel_I_33_5 TaxID=1566289 RepID=UPI0011A62989|nr:four helix bundle protein [Lutibacter sp. Hel_I_33_5]TVZ56227.1 four helix bundle protein [Lutibacter sp. Hel_I_33_5]